MRRTRIGGAAEEALVEFDTELLKRCDWAMSVEDGPLASYLATAARLES